MRRDSGVRRREAITLLAFSPVLACSRSRLSPGAIELVIPSEAATIDPRYASDVYGLRISHLVHATLAAPDPSTLAPVAPASFRNSFRLIFMFDHNR